MMISAVSLGLLTRMGLGSTTYYTNILLGYTVPIVIHPIRHASNVFIGRINELGTWYVARLVGHMLRRKDESSMAHSSGKKAILRLYT